MRRAAFIVFSTIARAPNSRSVRNACEDVPAVAFSEYCCIILTTEHGVRESYTLWTIPRGIAPPTIPTGRVRVKYANFVFFFFTLFRVRRHRCSPDLTVRPPRAIHTPF